MTAGDRSTTAAERFPVVVLAAGTSSRLGHPKQLVAYRGEPLVRRAARIALEAATGPVIVVLDVAWQACREALDGLAVDIVKVNGDGSMAHSIAAGLGQMWHEHPGGAGAILMTCDQPRVTAADLRALVAAHRAQGRPMAACAYAGTIGTPALFTGPALHSLGSLAGDGGARQLLRERPGDVAQVPCPHAAFDVDTPDDEARLTSEK